MNMNRLSSDFSPKTPGEIDAHEGRDQEGGKRIADLQMFLFEGCRRLLQGAEGPRMVGWLLGLLISSPNFSVRFWGTSEAEQALRRGGERNVGLYTLEKTGVLGSS